MFTVSYGVCVWWLYWLASWQHMCGNLCNFRAAEWWLCLFMWICQDGKPGMLIHRLFCDFWDRERFIQLITNQMFQMFVVLLYVLAANDALIGEGWEIFLDDVFAMTSESVGSLPRNTMISCVGSVPRMTDRGLSWVMMYKVSLTLFLYITLNIRHTTDMTMTTVPRIRHCRKRTKYKYVSEEPNKLHDVQSRQTEIDKEPVK